MYMPAYIQQNYCQDAFAVAKGADTWVEKSVLGQKPKMVLAASRDLELKGNRPSSVFSVECIGWFSSSTFDVVVYY